MPLRSPWQKVNWQFPPKDSQVATEDSTLLIVLLAGSVIITTALAVCVCCKKSKGFAEFRSSTQLNDFAQAQPVGEVTLFPPPSLSLSREDLDVSFEPLPKPQTNGSNRSNEILQWIGNRVIAISTNSQLCNFVFD